MKSKFSNLEERLIEFAIMAIDLSEKLPKTFTGKHIGNQLVRSGTSPALNYGEAQAAESRKDFIHKMRICLKELRESYICLRITDKKYGKQIEGLSLVLTESNELVAIFTQSIKTASVNLTR
jgi:four helix bundle protein